MSLINLAMHNQHISYISYMIYIYIYVYQSLLYLWINCSQSGKPQGFLLLLSVLGSGGGVLFAFPGCCSLNFLRVLAKIEKFRFSPSLTRGGMSSLLALKFSHWKEGTERRSWLPRLWDNSGLLGQGGGGKVRGSLPALLCPDQ